MANGVTDSWSRLNMVGGSNSGRVASRDLIKSAYSDGTLGNQLFLRCMTETIRLLVSRTGRRVNKSVLFTELRKLIARILGAVIR